jgi:hypothetical protein
VSRLPLASLPGPRAHLDAVAADLTDGFSCVWLVPDEFVARGTADDLLDGLAARADSVRLPPPEPGRPAPFRWSRRVAVGSTSLPAWAAAEIGRMDLDDVVDAADEVVPEPSTPIGARLAMLFGSPSGDGYDPITDLLASGELDGRLVVVCGWEENAPDEVAALLTRITATGKSMGVPPAKRPRVLVAARERDVPSGWLDAVDPVTTRVHWWWGVCGRIDTAVVVADSRRRDRRASSADCRAGAGVRERVIAEVLVEVAGPDLELALYLATSWDGRLDTLPERIKAFGYGDELAANARRDRAPLVGNRPPREVRSAWASGVTDLWDGQLRTSPAADMSARVDNLVWRGQSRALTPVVDEYRGYLETRVRKRANVAVLAEMSLEDRRGAKLDGHPTLELGAMAWAVTTRRVTLPRQEVDLLFCLRDVRNALAHLRVLSDQDLDRLVKILPSEL